MIMAASSVLSSESYKHQLIKKRKKKQLESYCKTHATMQTLF